MNTDWQTLLWLALGLILALSEFAVPGLVVVFLGVGALVVALLRWLGIVTTLPASLMTWIAASVASAMVLRGWLLRLFPPDTSHNPYHPDLDAVGEEVEVMETVRATDQLGRVKVRGTTWSATSVGPVIAAGGRARLVARHDLVWTVAPLEGSAADTP